MSSLFGCGLPTVDAFASKDNRRFPEYWSVDDDAFTKSWRGKKLLWINPPFDVFDRVVYKLKEEKAKAIVVVPQWLDKGWWKDLQDISVD